LFIIYGFIFIPILKQPWGKAELQVEFASLSPGLTPAWLHRKPRGEHRWIQRWLLHAGGSHLPSGEAAGQIPLLGHAPCRHFPGL